MSISTGGKSVLATVGVVFSVVVAGALVYQSPISRDSNNQMHPPVEDTVGEQLRGIAMFDAIAAVKQESGGDAQQASSSPTVHPEPEIASGDPIPENIPTISRQTASEGLFQATEDAVSSFSLGPITACFDQMRAIACPIAGSIPIVKDIVGRLSMELGISCPTGASGNRT